MRTITFFRRNLHGKPRKWPENTRLRAIAAILPSLAHRTTKTSLDVNQNIYTLASVKRRKAAVDRLEQAILNPINAGEEIVM
jgi:hypothetical protein